MYKRQTYNSEDGTFICNATEIGEDQKFELQEYSYGQTDLYYGDWYNTIRPKASLRVFTIDNDDDSTISVETSYSAREFRITIL